MQNKIDLQQDQGIKIGEGQKTLFLLHFPNRTTSVARKGFPYYSKPYWIIGLRRQRYEE